MMVSTRCAEAPVLFAKQRRRQAVTPISETRTNWCCFGGPRCTCRISSTFTTGSSPSTRRRLASVHLTPRLFASSLLPGEPLASSSKSVSSKCCAKARAGARARRGAPGSTRMGQSTPTAARVGAATAILDRGFGKPRQGVELSGHDGGPIERKEMSDEARLEPAFAG